MTRPRLIGLALVVAFAFAASYAVAAPLPGRGGTAAPTSRIVAGALLNAMQHHDKTAGTHYRFYDARCEKAGARWVCTIRARSHRGKLIVFYDVTYTPHVGFDFGPGSLLWRARES